MYNCHIHTFLEKDIPRKFLPFGLVSVLNSKIGYFIFSKLLKNLNPFSNKDSFDRMLQFIDFGKEKSQAALLQDCADNYPDKTKFIVLPMDMAYMGAGKVPREYYVQLKELSELSKINKSVIPFIHIDPRRPEYTDLFKWAIIQNGFKGVKLYPPLGVFPFDDRFDIIYSYCESAKLPIMAHCTSGNPVHYKGSKKELLQLLKYSIIPVNEKLSNKELCSNFTHPLNYHKVFEKFPNIKICLAHFGRENEWDKIIRGMMVQYKGLYTDISYSLANTEHWGYLKVLLSTDEVLRSRCLFGSDFYMNAMEGKEKQFSLNLRAYLGEELWQIISVDNPNKYLYE